jgi:aspartate carbamoyltransferase catalytic subunit
VVIVGDVLHSRVCSYLCVENAAQKVTKTLIPRYIESLGVTVEPNLIKALGVVDVANMLRAKRKNGCEFFPSTREYTAIWCR